MSKRVIVMNFDYESISYQAFSEIKKMHAAGEIKGEQMAIIQHRDGGSHKFDIKDFLDFTGNNHSATNSTIGMLIGLLGGPLGMLLGWFAGSMIGSAKDAKEITDATSVFEHVASEIREGDTGVVLLADEDDNRPLNSLIFNELGGHIARLDYEDVEKEITDAKQLEDTVQEHAQEGWKKRQDNDDNSEI